MTPSLLLRKRGPGPEAPRLPTSDHRPEPFVALPEHREVQSEGGPPPTSRLSPAPGFALVATLLMITVITGAAVAFFQSTRIERFVSRNYADLARAQLAAESGHALAASLLRAATANDHFIVVLNPTNRQLFLGNGSNQTALSTFAYLPLFSHATNPTSYTTNSSDLVTASNQPAMSVDGGVTFTNTLPGGLTVTSPAVSWINLTNAEGRTNARFAFWVEDLSGRLDLSVAGSTGTNARRPTGTNPAELALWSLFNPGTTNDPENAVVKKLINARQGLLTPATARLVDTNAVTAAVLQNLATGLLHDTNEPELVPYGFGYLSNGLPKLNLNQLATLPNSTALISDQIKNNLPKFGDRGGGMNANNYLANVAANIADWIDADLKPKSGPGIRGVEGLPFLNERLTQFKLQGPPTNTGRSRWMIRIETTEYFEFWNLHSRTSPATTVNVLFTNRQPIQYVSATNFNIVTNYSVTLPAMPPGSFFVTNTPTRTNEFTYSALASPGTNPICTLIGNTRTVEYAIQSEDTTFDQGCGSNYQDVELDGGQLVYFSASYPGLGSKLNIAGTANGDFLNSVGDPRATFYMTNENGPRPQMQQSWNNGNTSFGGRTIQRGNSPRLSTEVRIEYWGDGGHSGTTGERGSGTTPPSTGLFLGNETNFAPAFANPNTSGQMERITDLGAVFDPLQWNEQNQSEKWPNEGGAWQNLTAVATADTAYAGGHSLRIGRPEFTRFTNFGTAAWQLLDLFAVGSRTTNSGITLLNSVPGKINLNTASAEVLRALAAGVVHSRDPVLAPNGTNFTIPAEAVTAFVAGVTNRRNTGPFFSPAQIAQITSGAASYPSNAVFGNTNLLGITAGNDAAAEEWFSRVYPLATVRSRNFLVLVIGQAMSTNNSFVSRPLATARLMYQIQTEPVRNPTNGLTTNVEIRKISTWTF